jgi:TPR repeat protein
MTDIFVSYARADREAVALIASALEAEGFSVWWDKEVLPGQQYAAETDQKLAAAQAVLVVWSKDSVDRTWVLDEAAVGRARNVLCQIRLDATALPLGFRQLDATDMTGWGGNVTAPAFLALRTKLAALKAEPAKPTAPLGLLTPQPAPQRTSARRWWLTGAVILTAGASLAALLTVAGPSFTRAPNSPPETVGQPGGDKPYGLSADDLAGFGAQDLVRIAVSMGGIDAIEAGANAGDALGLGLSCLANTFGEGMPREVATARARCEAASAAGSSLGPLMLARLAQASEAGLTPDQADGFLQLAADAGDPRALTELARRTLTATPPDPARAAALAEQAAKMGHHPAELLLGWMFETGTAGPADLAQAYSWYDAAAQKAYPPGLTASARLLEEGLGTVADPEGARSRYTEAANRGDGEASYRLALMLEAGRGGPVDRDRALTLMRAAVAADYEGATQALALMEGEPAPVTQATAVAP